MKLEDGRGSGTLASVSGVQRLNVSSKIAPRIFYIGRDDKRSFTWSSEYSASTGDEVIYIKNTDTDRNLIIHAVSIGCVNNGVFTLSKVTGTASGTQITPTNLNLSSGLEASSAQYGDAAVTGLTIGAFIYKKRILANTTELMQGVSEAVILGFGEAIAVTYTGATGNIDAVITGYFDNEGQR